MDLLTLAQDIRVIEGFGGTEWTNQTRLHPLALTMTAVCGLGMLALPRRYALWPVLLLLCFVAPAQRLVVAGLDFNLIRLMVLFGACRVLFRSEYTGLRWTTLDGLLVAFVMTRTLVYTAQHASTQALIYQLGLTFDGIGMYFLFRCLVRNWDDLLRTVTGFVALSVPVAVFFAIEHQSGRNLFSMFGGVPEFTKIREGRMRCQGAFAHPIIAGCFWASVLPLVVAMWWWRGWYRLWATVGVPCVLVIVVLTASSTPVTAVAFLLLGWLFYPLRSHMKWVMLVTALIACALHLGMKAPVWHLISRIQITAGNTGWHRFMLIDSAINRFGEWALLGTRSTAHWFWGGQDVTNQYVLEGVTGGVLSLALFVACIVFSFAMCGRLWRAYVRDRARVLTSWTLGVTLFVHCTNFIGVSYFGQATPLWYFHLAAISSLHATVVGVGARRPVGTRQVTSAPGAPLGARMAPSLRGHERSQALKS